MTVYLLLTREQELLAKGILESGSPDNIMQLLISEGDPEAVAAQEILCVFGSNSGEMPVQCKVIKQKEDRIVLQKIMVLNPELRRSYRIPADFDSFIYPVDHGWRGRRKMHAVDLSCGGVSFCAPDFLRKGDIAQVVIPNIRFPVLVQIRVLRREILSDGQAYYGCKFEYACREEEESVCQAVFGIQIKHKKNGTAKNYTI